VKSSNRLLNFLKTFLQAIVHLLFYLPLLLTVAIYGFVDYTSWIWLIILPLLYALGSFIIHNRPRIRLFTRITAAIMLSFLPLLLLTGGMPSKASQISALLVCFAIGIAVVMKGMQSVSKGWDKACSPVDMIVGIILYIFIQPLKVTLLQELTAYNTALLLGGVASLLIYLFLVNERMITKETEELPQSSLFIRFKRQNRLLLLLISALIVIIAMFRELQKVVENTIGKLLASIIAWFNRPREENEPVEAPPMEPQAPMLPEAELKDPALWLQILERILIIAVNVMLAAALLVVIYFVGKKLFERLGNLVSKLLARGEGMRESENLYIDEVENLMTLNKFRARVNNKLQGLLPSKRSREIQWSDLQTNGERIRFLYSTVLKKHMKQGYSMQASLTPRETAVDLTNKQLEKAELEELIDAYEVTRYGDRIPNDDTVTKLKNKLYKG